MAGRAELSGGELDSQAAPRTQRDMDAQRASAAAGVR